MDCNYILRKEISEKYCLGQLDESEKSQYEQHIALCENCRLELKNQREIISLLKESGEIELRKELQRQLREQRESSTFNKFLLLKVASVLIFISLIPGVLYYNRYITKSQYFQALTEDQIQTFAPPENRLAGESKTGEDSLVILGQSQEKIKPVVRKKKIADKQSILSESAPSGAGMKAGDSEDALNTMIGKASGMDQSLNAPLPSLAVGDEVSDMSSLDMVLEPPAIRNKMVTEQVLPLAAEATPDSEGADLDRVTAIIEPGIYVLRDISQKELLGEQISHSKRIMAMDNGSVTP